jgi:hypothetical protein
VRARDFVIVLVLEKAGLVTWLIDPCNGVAKPSAGGEPLCNIADLSFGSRRLPGITQRNVLPNVDAVRNGDYGP